MMRLSGSVRFRRRALARSRPCSRSRCSACSSAARVLRTRRRAAALGCERSRASAASCAARARAAPPAGPSAGARAARARAWRPRCANARARWLARARPRPRPRSPPAPPAVAPAAGPRTARRGRRRLAVQRPRCGRAAVGGRHRQQLGDLAPDPLASRLRSIDASAAIFVPSSATTDRSTSPASRTAAARPRTGPPARARDRPQSARSSSGRAPARRRSPERRVGPARRLQPPARPHARAIAVQDQRAHHLRQIRPPTRRTARPPCSAPVSSNPTASITHHAR